MLLRHLRHSLAPRPGYRVVRPPRRQDLRALARRDDTLVVLATAGVHKARLMRQVLDAGLCNTLITDDASARALLHLTESAADSRH